MRRIKKSKTGNPTAFTYVLRMEDSLRFFLFAALLIASKSLYTQSLELMAGDKRVFADIQWLKPLDQSLQWSVFSRTRATVDYNNNTNLFSGAYLNYTTKIGLGGSIVGKIGAAGGGIDAGLHIFKPKKNWMLFGLASIGMKKDLEYSWFSIFRYTPSINARWKLYASLELFTLFNEGGHALSVQRLRIGLDFKAYQFGLANNLTELGKAPLWDNNFGVFIRKSF